MGAPSKKTPAENPSQPTFVLCLCSKWTRSAYSEKAKALSISLKKSGKPHIVLDDLCGICAKTTADLKKIFESKAKLVFIACRQRAVSSLLEYAGLGKSPDNHRVIDLLGTELDALIGELGLPPQPKKPASSTKAKREKSKNDWTPWFPVIDRKRCSNCGQCLSFCLFGVYSRDEKSQIKVSKPENCKTNCPACAKICPNFAIIFPKYDEAPFDGSHLPDDARNSFRPEMDLRKMDSSQIYQTLMSRMKGKK